MELGDSIEQSHRAHRFSENSTTQVLHSNLRLRLREAKTSYLISRTMLEELKEHIIETQYPVKRESADFDPQGQRKSNGCSISSSSSYYDYLAPPSPSSRRDRHDQNIVNLSRYLLGTAGAERCVREPLDGSLRLLGLTPAQLRTDQLKCVQKGARQFKVGKEQQGCEYGHVNSGGSSVSRHQMWREACSLCLAHALEKRIIRRAMDCAALFAPSSTSTGSIHHNHSKLEPSSSSLLSASLTPSYWTSKFEYSSTNKTAFIASNPCSSFAPSADAVTPSSTFSSISSCPLRRKSFEGQQQPSQTMTKKAKETDKNLPCENKKSFITKTKLLSSEISSNMLSPTPICSSFMQMLKSPVSLADATTHVLAIFDEVRRRCKRLLAKRCELKHKKEKLKRLRAEGEQSLNELATRALSMARNEHMIVKEYVGNQAEELCESVLILRFRSEALLFRLLRVSHFTERAGLNSSDIYTINCDQIRRFAAERSKLNEKTTNFGRALKECQNALSRYVALLCEHEPRCTETFRNSPHSKDYRLDKSSTYGTTKAIPRDHMESSAFDNSPSSTVRRTDDGRTVDRGYVATEALVRAAARNAFSCAKRDKYSIEEVENLTVEERGKAININYGDSLCGGTRHVEKEQRIMIETEEREPEVEARAQRLCDAVMEELVRRRSIRLAEARAKERGERRKKARNDGNTRVRLRSRGLGCGEGIEEACSGGLTCTKNGTVDADSPFASLAPSSSGFEDVSLDFSFTDIVNAYRDTQNKVSQMRRQLKRLKTDMNASNLCFSTSMPQSR